MKPGEDELAGRRRLLERLGELHDEPPGEPAAARRVSINEWSEDSRPRERCLSLGASALSNAELLAILIHSGTPSQNAVELMREVLASCDDSLDKLGELTYDQLTAFKGIGQAKAVTLMAACEFGRRRMVKDARPKSKLDNSDKVFHTCLKSLFWDKTEEECWVVLLNQSLHFISKECIGTGGLTSVSADIRKVLKLALLKNATAIVLAHNHPSGSLKPGAVDDTTTRNLGEACRVMNIRLLDHLIVHGDRYYSYAEQGRLP